MYIYIYITLYSIRVQSTANKAKANGPGIAGKWQQAVSEDGFYALTSPNLQLCKLYSKLYKAHALKQKSRYLLTG